MELNVMAQNENTQSSADILHADFNFLHLGLLALILALATACRFYHIDVQGLWASELANAVMIMDRGWFSMVSSMVYGSAEAPGYLSLLYMVSQLFGYSEFVLRLPSALAGICSVYVLYLLGKRVHSPYAGLLAASSLAFSFHAVDYSREVQVSSSLMLLVLINFYCFLSVMFQSGRNASVNVFKAECNTVVSRFSFVWQLPIPASPMGLLVFWATGIVMLYLHYAAFVILLAEAILVALLCLWRGVRKDIFTYECVIFLPIILAFLPWLPAVYVHIGKLLSAYGDVPVVINTDIFTSLWLSKIPFLKMPLMVLVGLAGLFSIFSLAMRRLRSIEATEMDIVVIFLVVATALLVLNACFVSVSNNAGVYLLLHPWFILLESVFLGGIIDKLPKAWIKNIVFLVCISVFSLVQLNFNKTSRIFNDKHKPNIGAAAKIIAKDRGFMAGASRPVFMSLPAANYYLERYGINAGIKQFALNAADVDDVSKVSAMTNEQAFYYLGVIDRSAFKDSSPMSNALLQKYRVLCRSDLRGIRLLKFSMALSPDNAAVESCGKKNIYLQGSTVADRVREL